MNCKRKQQNDEEWLIIKNQKLIDHIYAVKNKATIIRGHDNIQSN